MKSDRFIKVGIQRELHIEWFDQAIRLHAMRFPKSEARQEIYAYLDSAPGFDAAPSLQTKTYLANVLIKSWIAPEQTLIPLRDEAFQLLQENSNFRLPLYWCLLGAAYPFWFAVARVVGRLLNLQNQVTQAQVVSRLKENYGDRQTISRRARYVIRSFVAWGVLKDSEVKGCYEKVAPVSIFEPNLVILMLESALLATSEAKGALGVLLNNPALFPFQLPVMTGDFVSQRSDRIDVVRYGLDDELLKLKGN
jgi:hypothetical protein